MVREHFIGKYSFECFDINVYGYTSGVPTSLILYPAGMYDDSGELAYLELPLEEVDTFCELLKACKNNFEGE